MPARAGPARSGSPLRTGLPSDRQDDRSPAGASGDQPAAPDRKTPSTSTSRMPSRTSRPRVAVRRSPSVLRMYPGHGPGTVSVKKSRAVSVETRRGSSATVRGGPEEAIWRACPTGLLRDSLPLDRGEAVERDEVVPRIGAQDGVADQHRPAGRMDYLEPLACLATISWAATTSLSWASSCSRRTSSSSTSRDGPTSSGFS